MTAWIRAHPIVSFYAFTFLFTWTAGVIGVYLNNNLTLIWLGVSAPAVVAIALTLVRSGKPGLELLLKKLFIWRVSWWWYLAIYLIPIGLVIGTVGLYRLSGGDQNTDLISWTMALSRGLPAVFGLSLLSAVMIAFEEVGWRGYVLPLLQDRYGWINASLIVGFFWGIWHLPEALDPNSVLHRLPLILSCPIFVVGTILYAFVYTWIWNNTQRSLLLMCLFHAFYDLLYYYADATFPYIINHFYLQYPFLLVLIGAIVVWMRKRPSLRTVPADIAPG
jgi:uncharacterized protein